LRLPGQRFRECRFGTAQRGLLLVVGKLHDGFARLYIVVHVEKNGGNAPRSLCRHRRLVHSFDRAVIDAL
jgi:hypothetical protein